MNDEVLFAAFMAITKVISVLIPKTLIAGWCANTSAMTAPSRFKSYSLILFLKGDISWLHIISLLQVCCPEFLGTFNNSVTRATEPVYAVSR